MASEAHVADVVLLAEVVLESYRPDTVLFDVLEPVGEDGSLVIEVEGQSRELSPMLEVFKAIQVAFDAAAAAVEVADPEWEGPRDVRALLENPTWTLEVEYLGSGSFSLKAVFGKKSGRKKVVAVGTLVGILLLVLNPPLGTIVLAVASGTGAVEELIPDKAPQQLLLDKTPTAPEPETRRGHVTRMHGEHVARTLAEESVATLKNNLQDAPITTVDNKELLNARVDHTRIGVREDK